MSQLWWYTARASGIVGWALLSAAVLWGLALSTRALGSRPRPSWLLDLHRFLGAAAVVFTSIHVGSLVADSYVHFGPTEVLVPLASAWHPVAVAWGIVALYLLLAVGVTSLLRRHPAPPLIVPAVPAVPAGAAHRVWTSGGGGARPGAARLGP